MTTETTVETPKYTFAAFRGWKVRFADGKTRRAILVRVTSPQGKQYDCRFVEGCRYTCSCEWHRRTGHDCKHLKAARHFLKHGAAPLEMPTSDGTHPQRARVTSTAPAVREVAVRPIPPAPYDPEAEAAYQAGLYDAERVAWEARTAGQEWSPQAA